jgi:Family of unknown function (DUF5957)
MKGAGLALLGAFAGLWVGLTVSATVGIAGALLLSRPIGVRYLEPVLAVVGAIALPIWYHHHHRPPQGEEQQ